MNRQCSKCGGDLDTGYRCNRCGLCCPPITDTFSAPCTMGNGWCPLHGAECPVKYTTLEEHNKDNMDILSFSGEYRWLSNFHPAQVYLDGELYQSVENAYQAAKTTDKAHREPFKTCTAGQAKKMGRSLDIRPDWEHVKVETMTSLIAQKFAPGTHLGVKLKATTGRIVEGNNWGDTFWGICKGKGLNMLGELIVYQRALLKKDVLCAFEGAV